MQNKYKDIVTFIRELYKQEEGIIPLHAPVFIGNEKKYLEDCINSTFVSSVGEYVDRFEESIAEYTGAKKAVACVNGTSALHIALKLVGVKENTEVITQPLTFVATTNAISYCNAKPVFLDVDLDTMGLSPIAVKKWLEENVEMKIVGADTHLKPYNKTSGRRISACLPMHTFGHPCKIDEIIEICNRFNIQVVEDAAESLGSFYKNQHTGTFGEIGVLSFNGNKIITSGGGGMLLFKDEELARRAKHLTTQAKVPHAWEFYHDEIGYNYRMPNINAALGLAQLEQLDVFLKSKNEIARSYKYFFENLDIHFVIEPQNSNSNYWLNCIISGDKNERNAILKFCNVHGVMIRPAWQLMNTLKIYENCQSVGLENVIFLADRIINLPSSINIWKK